MTPLRSVLEQYGPSRSSRLVEALGKQFSIAPEAARKQISRAKPPIHRFPIPMLPKREAFVYLDDQRKTESFWCNFLDDLRETKSIYGIALDGLTARGGIVDANEFHVISGAPLALRGQVASSRVADTLCSADAIERRDTEFGDCYQIKRYEIANNDYAGFRARRRAELVMLDGLREWARKLGLGSYNQIAIRGDDHPRRVGQFVWDLTGPSYLLPLRPEKAKNGFLVADVFASEELTEHMVGYFIRKVQLLRASFNSGDVLAILMAEGFTGKALKTGHAAGVVLATPTNLFGRQVGEAITSLVATLRKAAAISAGNPSRLAHLIDDLSEIEGAAGNLRGILFELICAYLARQEGGSIDVGVTARHPETGKPADIDIFKVISRAECVFIECKGRNPGGMVSLHEVEDWLRRIPIFRAYLTKREDLREARMSFEIWTSGGFEQDALSLLESENSKRRKSLIRWKDGAQVADLARRSKEKAILNALNEHFLKHPLHAT